MNYNISIKNALIESENALIEPGNALIASENALIEAAIDNLTANANMKENAKTLFKHMGFDGVFGRNEVMGIMNIAITAAGNLINKLKTAELIEPVLGKGKGKYKFTHPK